MRKGKRLKVQKCVENSQKDDFGYYIMSIKNCID